MNTKLVSVISLVLMLCVMVPSVTFAQGPSGDPNFEFRVNAEWLAPEEIYLARVLKLSDVYTVPNQQPTAAVITLNPEWVVKVAATYRDWLLVSAWDEVTYIDSGWVQDTGSNLERLSTLEIPTEQVVPNCDTSGRQEFVILRFNDGWVHYAQSTGCNLFYEGRIENISRHDYWVYRDEEMVDGAEKNIQTDVYLTNGFMWLLQGTAWVFPNSQSIAGFNRTDEEPMLLAFMGAKFEIMTDSGYEFPIRVNMADGSYLDFEFGSVEPSGDNHCSFSQPTEVNITGIFSNEREVYVGASIGAPRCLSIMLWQEPDDTWHLEGFWGARENIEYSQYLLAVMMPSSWTPQQVGTYIYDLVANSGLQSGTVVYSAGISELPDTFQVP